MLNLNLIYPDELFQALYGPTIIVNTIDGNYYGSPPNIDVDFNDTTGLDSAFYKVDSYLPTGPDTSGWTEIFSDYVGTSYTTDFIMDNNIWSSLSEGSHTVYFKVWDDSGNVVDGASHALLFNKDTSEALITVNNQDGNYYATPPLLDIDFHDPAGLDDAYYKVDSYTPLGIDTSGWIEIFSDHLGTSYTSDFTINSSIWSSLTEGSHTVFFKAWDDLGNINDGSTPSWQFNIDLTFPSIILNTLNNSYFNSPPLVDIDFFDSSGLDAAYYKVDSYTPLGMDTSGWIEIFSDFVGTSYTTDFAMDNIIWSSLSEGSHIVYFKVWDDLGNIHDGLVPALGFIKDTEDPTITMITSSGGTYNTPPSIDIEIFDSLGLNYAYYKVDSYTPLGTDILDWIEIFNDYGENNYTSNIDLDVNLWNTLADGLHTVYFKTWDITGNINDGSTPSWQFSKDSSAPIILINNVNGSLYNSVPTLDIDFSDLSGLDAAYYKVDSYTPIATNITGWIEIFSDYTETSFTTDFTLDNDVWISLSEGFHVVYFKTWDDLGNIIDGSTPSWQFVIDFSGADIVMNIENDSYYNTPPLIDVDFSDPGGLDDAYYKVDSYSPTGFDTTGWNPIFADFSGTSYTTDFAMDSSVWNGLSDGSHTVYFKLWDDSGNINDGSTPSWQFYKDTGTPSITVNTPNGNYYASTPLMDVDFSDVSGLDDAYYKVDSYSPTGLDTTGWIQIVADFSGTSYTTDFAMDSSVWNGLSDGSHTIYFKAWDDLGNINDGSSPSWQFYKDTGAPSITVNPPNGNYYASTPLMDVDFSDVSGLDDAYYKVDSYSPTGLDTTGWTQIFTSHSGTSYTTDFTMDVSVWNGLSDGSHTIYFKAWDDLGNINNGSSPSWQFYKDTGAPSITVNPPNGNYYASTPLMDVDFSDLGGLGNAYYKVDSYNPTGLDTTGWTPIFTSHSGTSYTTDFTMDVSVWSGLSDGSHTVYFKSWDDLGNINDGSTPLWQFSKDSSAPVILINNLNGSLYNSVPTLDIDFSDPGGLDAAYYKVDSYTPLGIGTSGWIEIFSNYPGTSYATDFLMDNGIWSSLSEGSHIVYFKIWDDLGNINDGSIPSWRFNIDLTPPNIIINTPNGKPFSTPAIFNVTFEDNFNLKSAYYKIESYTPMGTDTASWEQIFIDISGKNHTTEIIISDFIWNALEEGSYKVYVKCWDDLGNVNDGPTPYWQFFKYFGTPIIKVNAQQGGYYNNPPIMDVDFYDPTKLNNAYYKIDSYNPLGLDTTNWVQIFSDLNSINYTTNFFMNNSIWSSLSEGSHVIYFKVWNYSGIINDGAQPSWQFYKDTIPPDIFLLSPSQDGVYQSSVTVSINITGHQYSYYYWDIDPFISTNSTLFALPIEDGSHTLHLQADDRAGNREIASFTFITDNTPPTAEIVGMRDNLDISKLITIMVTPHDEYGIKYVSFSLGSQLLLEQSSDYIYQFDPTMYPYGTYLFTITIEDLAGNVLSRVFTIYLEEQVARLPELYWQILISVVSGIVIGVIGLIFFFIKKKIKKKF